MNEKNLKPEKITKPIQLLAAWLLGLILLETSLLTAVATIKYPDWLPSMFGISAVAIIPLFLGMIFLLQTKYRPEMQEDSFYSKYLDRNSMTFEYMDNSSKQDSELKFLRNEINEFAQVTKNNIESIKKILESEKATPTSKEISEKILESAKKIEELKRIAKLSTLTLKVNMLLPNYFKIVEEIKNIGFTNFYEFGSKPLTEFLIGFGKNVPISVVKDIVFALIPLGLQFVKEVGPVKEGIDKENAIYIGSYFNSPNSYPIDESLINKLNSVSLDKTFGDLF
jgi:hypothetical protein